MRPTTEKVSCTSLSTISNCGSLEYNKRTNGEEDPSTPTLFNMGDERSHFDLPEEERGVENHSGKYSKQGSMSTEWHMKEGVDSVKNLRLVPENNLRMEYNPRNLVSIKSFEAVSDGHLPQESRRNLIPEEIYYLQPPPQPRSQYHPLHQMNGGYGQSQGQGHRVPVSLSAKELLREAEANVRNQIETLDLSQGDDEENNDSDDVSPNEKRDEFFINSMLEGAWKESLPQQPTPPPAPISSKSFKSLAKLKSHDFEPSLIHLTPTTAGTSFRTSCLPSDKTLRSLPDMATQKGFDSRNLDWQSGPTLMQIPPHLEDSKDLNSQEDFFNIKSAPNVANIDKFAQILSNSLSLSVIKCFNVPLR